MLHLERKRQRTLLCLMFLCDSLGQTCSTSSSTQVRDLRRLSSISQQTDRENSTDDQMNVVSIDGYDVINENARQRHVTKNGGDSKVVQRNQEKKGKVKKDDVSTDDIMTEEIVLKPIPQETRDKFTDEDFRVYEHRFRNHCDSEGTVPYQFSWMLLMDAISNFEFDKTAWLEGEEVDLDFEGFLDTILEYRHREDDEMMKSFKSFDLGNKGYLDLDDLRHVMIMLGETSLNEDQLKEMMKEADKDGDGVLNFTDFAGVMNAK